MCHSLKSSKFQFQAVSRRLWLNVSCFRRKSKKFFNIHTYVTCGCSSQKSRFCQLTSDAYSLPISRTKCSTGEMIINSSGVYIPSGYHSGPWSYQGTAPPHPRRAAAVVPVPSHRHQAARAAWQRSTVESVMGLREMASWNIFGSQVDQGGRPITTVYWTWTTKRI